MKERARSKKELPKQARYQGHHASPGETIEILTGRKHIYNASGAMRLLIGILQVHEIC
jgi:hypothetical protein